MVSLVSFGDGCFCWRAVMINVLPLKEPTLKGIRKKMKRFKRKIIRDIYKGHVTSLYSFIEKYIFSNDKLPSNFKSEFIDKSDDKKHKYFMINDRELTDKYLKEFSHWIKFLSIKGYIKTEPEKLPFKVNFIYWADFSRKYTSYDPYFANCGFLQVKTFIINADKLKKYISNGFRTEDEFARYKRLLRDRILFKYIPLVAILITLGLTIYNIFFNDNERIYQKENHGIKSDTTQTLKNKKLQE